jgi:hypothetical protein
MGAYNDFIGTAGVATGPACLVPRGAYLPQAPGGRIPPEVSIMASVGFNCVKCGKHVVYTPPPAQVVLRESDRSKQSNRNKVHVINCPHCGAANTVPLN